MSRKEDYSDMVGGVHINFTRGEVTLDPAHPALLWYQRSAGYEVTPVYGVASARTIVPAPAAAV